VRAGAPGITAAWKRYDGFMDPAERTVQSRYERVVLPHLDAGYNLARWLTHNGHDAEDVVQEACIKALRYVGALYGTDARSWFLTIVRHSCYDWLKRNRPAEISRSDGDSVDDVADDSALSPEQAAIRSADSRVLADAIAALPLGFREVLILRELEEMSYKDIARIVDIPIGTVMSRLARARGLLQRSPVLHSIRERSAGGER
jgi:RNA polymerase sigma-70 factor, ECF subfamily